MFYRFRWGKREAWRYATVEAKSQRAAHSKFRMNCKRAGFTPELPVIIDQWQQGELPIMRENRLDDPVVADEAGSDRQVSNPNENSKLEKER